MDILDILESLESDNGRLAKGSVMEANKDNKLLHRFFSLAFDPWKNWGVAKYDRPKTPGSRGHGDDIVVEFLDLLIRLDKRELKGNAAKKAVSDIIQSGDAVSQKWLERLLWRNLRCGVSVSTINKLWPGTVVPFGVALAGTLPTKGVNGNFIFSEPVTYPVRVEAKLDGLRCVAVKHNGEVTLYTRNGTVLETLPRIKAAVEALPLDNFVLDGEVMGEDWNESASVVMSAKSKKDDSTMCYHAFDLVPFADWQAQKTALTYAERLAILNPLIGAQAGSSPFRLVKSMTCNNEGELRSFYTACLDENYEGVMLKDMGAVYKWKRSAAILKLKPVATEEGVVVGWYNASAATKRAGQFGGFRVLTPNGVVTRVGGGYTDKLKTEVNANPDSYIGKIVECEHQAPTTPSGAMRFPVFCRFRSENDVDAKVLEAYKTFVSCS